jgi:hypothetical protein
MEHVCSVAATKQVAGAKADATPPETNGDTVSKTIHVGGLQAAVTYFARVVPYTFFRGEASNVSSGQGLWGECRGINADEILW